MSQVKGPSGCFIAAAAIVGIVAVAQIAGSIDSKSVDQACDEAHLAVNARLKSGAMADFSTCDSDTARQQPDGSWAVGGSIASRGGVADSREIFFVHEHRDILGWGWTVDSVQIGDKPG